MIGSPRPSPSAGFFEFGPFRLEVSTRALYRGDEFVPVTPKALDTLFVLVEEAGRLVTKAELMRKVWPDAYVEEGSIANNVSMLRKLLNPSFEGDGPIATVARRGYRFVAPVRLRTTTGHDALNGTPDVSSNSTSNPSPYLLFASAVILVAATVAIMLVLRPTASVAPAASARPDARQTLSSNADALRSYFLGLEALRIQDMPRATELLSAATKKDPDFALAHSALSIAWRVRGYDVKARDAAKVAFDLSGRLGREDQLAVQGAYHEVMSDWQSAIEKYQTLWTFFPDNPTYALKLVHQQLLGGRLVDARRTLDQVRALPSPSDTDPRFDQVEADWFFRNGRFADVVRVTARGIEHARLVHSGQLEARMLLVQGRAEFRRGAIDKARGLFKESQQVFEALGDPAGVAEVLRADAQVLASQGTFAEGMQRIDQSLKVATSIEHQRLIPEILVFRAELLRKMTDFDAAKADAEAAVKAFRASRNRSGLARGLTALGGVETAQRNYARARTHLEEAHRLAKEIGEPVVATNAGEALAELVRVATLNVAVR